MHYPKAPEPRIVIALVNWNGKADTVACLTSLLGLVDRDIRLIVCDNASSDGSVEALLEWGRTALPEGEVQAIGPDEPPARWTATARCGRPTSSRA